MGHIELDRDAPPSFAVEDAQAPQQRAPLADGQVGRAVVAHLHHPVTEVEGLHLGERTPRSDPVHDEHRQ